MTPDACPDSVSAADSCVETPITQEPRPSAADAEAAIRTLLRYVGEDPAREGLSQTPARVARAYSEYFSGYAVDPHALMERTFSETDGYDEMVVLRNVDFVSHCEHHIAPFVGTAHIAYLPHRRVVGISKLARVVNAFARRLQIQERLTVQIADAVNTVLQPRGVAVVLRAEHQCMTMRGVNKPGVSLVTSRMVGDFRENPATRREFLAMIGEQSLSNPPR